MRLRKWRARPRFSAFLLAMVTGLGLATLGGSAYSQSAGDDLLQFILAEQAKAKARLTEYRYTVTISGGASVGAQHTSDRFWHQLTVVRKDGVERASLEYHSMIEEPTGTKEWHRAARSLVGPEYTIVWNDVRRSTADIYFAEDWADQPQDWTSKHVQSRDAVVIADAVNLAYGTDRESIEELYYGEQRRLTSDNRPRWTAERASDTNGHECFLVKRFFQGSKEPDLVLTIDPARDFVVTECVSKSSQDPERRTVRKEYQEVDGRWFLKRQVTSDAVNDKIVERQEQVYENVRLSGVADEEVSFESLQLPEGAAIMSHTPGSTGATINKLEGTSIIPVTNPAERHELTVKALRRP